MPNTRFIDCTYRQPGEKPDDQIDAVDCTLDVDRILSREPEKTPPSKEKRDPAQG